jgi:hypothetical protein
VVDGKIIGGFALVARPAEYGGSGIRILIVNHEGVVYEKDSGPGMALQARQMTRSIPTNPGAQWCLSRTLSSKKMAQFSVNYSEAGGLNTFS